MNELTKKINEEPIKKARQVFAEYGLNPEKFPELKKQLDYLDSQSKTVMFNCGPRTCIVCESKYYGGSNVCEPCQKIYKEEDLFWRQGKVVE